jgi:peptidoglycan LD-endopeptidase LytH
MRRGLRGLLLAACAAALAAAVTVIGGDTPVQERSAASAQPSGASRAPGSGLRDQQRGREEAAPAGGEERATATSGEAGVLEELQSRALLNPVEGADAASLVQSFHEPRGTGTHEAIDILAPRHTPVRAVDDGRIVKLFVSERGGLTVYQFDPTERVCYYYAHLEAYAPGLEEGALVARGEQIGTVGTSGNAPDDTPHLHFAIFELGPERRWWEGRPLDPYLVLR